MFWYAAIIGPFLWTVILLVAVTLLDKRKQAVSSYPNKQSTKQEFITRFAFILLVWGFYIFSILNSTPTLLLGGIAFAIGQIQLLFISAIYSHKNYDPNLDYNRKPKQKQLA